MMSNVFYVHFSTDGIRKPTDDFYGTSSHSQITSRKTLIAQDRDFYFVKFYGLREHDASAFNIKTL